MKTIIGIDWSKKKHNIRVHNEQGGCILRFEIPHTIDGFALLRRRLLTVQPNPTDCLVAIETAHNLLVDFLLESGFTVYVIAPTTVDGNRSRLGTSRAKDDDRDAYLLTDILRTDRYRLIPWRPLSPLLAQLKQKLSWIDDLTDTIVQETNRLRQTLYRFYPQALAAFSDFTTEIALNFLITFPSPDLLASLDYSTWVTFCQQSKYYRPAFYPKRFAKLSQPAFNLPQLNSVYTDHTHYLATHLLRLHRQKKLLLKEVALLSHQHDDAFIFQSIPGAGQLLAPKLLVHFGDDRDRFPSSSILQATSGTAPVTKQSGDSRSVVFRRACHHPFRNTMQQVAKSSIDLSPWAYTYYTNARRRGLSKSHAYRCLANRWVHIIWTLWQRHQSYDVSLHLQHVQLKLQPTSG